MDELFLGVDGGQSSTTALIGDNSGRALGTGVGGPCNHVGAAEGRRRFTSAITESLRQACAAAGLDPRTVAFEAACLGMSGGPEDKRDILAEVLNTRELVVTHDALIALAGATGGGPGIITVAGTGSIAFGRNAAGRSARVGGWGYIFGDEGGAFDITRQAVRASLRWEEGWGPPTSLRERLLAATGAENANEVLHRLYTDEWPRSRTARLAPLVDAAAAEGDGVASAILRDAAHHLASMAASVRLQLFKPGEPARVAYIGGVFRSRLLLQHYRMLVELEDANTCAPPLHGPAAGALLEAYRARGLHPALSNVPEFKS